MSTGAAVQPTAAAEPELRQISVFFCDLVGSTPLAQEMEAEDYHELIQDYQRTVGDILRKYEGNVARTFGDGILAFFGHPVAHEDAPERAVLAALDAIDAMRQANAARPGQPPLSIRIGIHTGQAVISRAAASAGSEVQAIGDSVNLAARLQGAAAPDTVVISAATLRLVPGRFVTSDLGEQALKGIQQPVRIYQAIKATGIRSRLEAAAQLTPFVGRRHELALLGGHWRQAADGVGRTVLLTAEPGFGKSRLLMTLRQQVQQTAPWLECRCAPLAQHSALAPWVQLLQRAWNLPDGAGDAVRLEAMEQGLVRAGQSPAEGIPLLAPLLNVKMSARYAPPPYGPELRRRKTLELLSQWCVAQAAQQPVLLAIEDLHWADASTVDLLGMLVERAPAHPLMLVPSARPEFKPAWPASPHVAQIVLEALGGDDTGAILDSIAGHRPLPAPVRERLLKQAGGVPLFLEEATRALLESGQLAEHDGRFELVGSLDRLSIPATLQDTLMARLDRLGPARQLIQLCAVIGREIPRRLLVKIVEQDEAALDRELCALLDAQMLYVRGEGADPTYVFKHALIQDAAYASIWKKTRARLHERAARAIEEHFPQWAKTEPELLASHFEAAGSVAPALRYKKAAVRKAARSSFTEAMAQAEQGLKLAATLPEGDERATLELDLNIALGDLAATAGQAERRKAEQAFARVKALSERLTDPVALGRALASVWVLDHQRADYSGALAGLARLLEIAEQLQNRRMQAHGWLSRGYPHFMRGELHEALAAVTRAEQITDTALAQATGPDAFIYDLIVPREVCAAWTHHLLGHYDRARQHLAAARARADAQRHPYLIAFAQVNGECALDLLEGRYDTLLPLARHLRQFTEQVGATDLNSHASWLYGVACCAAGRVDEGLDVYRRTIALGHEVGSLAWHAPAHGHIAGLMLRAHRLPDARQALDAGFEMFTRHEERFWAADLHRLRGELLQAEGAAAAEIAACFDEALTVARDQGALALELRAATSYARFLREHGRAADGRALLAPVRERITEGLDTADVRAAQALLGELGAG